MKTWSAFLFMMSASTVCPHIAGGECVCVPYAPWPGLASLHRVHRLLPRHPPWVRTRGRQLVRRAQHMQRGMARMDKHCLKYYLFIISFTSFYWWNMDAVSMFIINFNEVTVVNPRSNFLSSVVIVTSQTRRCGWSVPHGAPSSPWQWRRCATYWHCDRCSWRRCWKNLLPA